MADTDGGLDSFFSAKYGPLPGWGWAGLAAAAGVGYIYLKDRKSSSTGTSSATATTTTTGFDYAPSIAAQQSEIQALQAQQGASSSASTAPSSTTGTSTTSTATFNPSSVVGQSLQQANQTLTQQGISTQYVYVQGQSKPLGSAQATVPYSSTPVTGISLSSPTQAVVTVS